MAEQAYERILEKSQMYLYREFLHLNKSSEPEQLHNIPTTQNNKQSIHEEYYQYAN